MNNMQAIVLAGGRGERLRPYTDDRPKPMIEVGGKPLLDYELGWLKKNHVTEIVLSCGYLHKVIQDYFGDGQRWGLDIRYAIEKEKLGRGGGIKFAMQRLSAGRAPVIVLNGDNVIDIDLPPALAQHAQSGALVTDILAPLVSSRGIVEVDERGRITQFLEKPELPHWINAGIYIFARQVQDLLPERGDHEDTTFPRLAAQGQLYAYKTRQLWRTVDTAKDISTLERELKTGQIHAPSLT